MDKVGKSELDDALNYTESYQGVKFHSDPLDTFLSEMGVEDLDSGIPSDEAAARLEVHGPNKHSEPIGIPWHIMFIKQLLASSRYFCGWQLCYALSPSHWTVTTLRISTLVLFYQRLLS